MDQTARVLLASDGKAVDIILHGDSDNRDFVLVLDAYDRKSTDIEDYGETSIMFRCSMPMGLRKRT